MLLQAFTAVHIAAIIASAWILMMNGAVGYQLLDDGTPLSLALVFGSAAILFIGTGYIALDTGFSWTGYWNSTLDAPNKAYALYTLYQLVPMIFLVVFFLLETVLVLRVLGERRPMRTWFCSCCTSCSRTDVFQSTSSLLHFSSSSARFFNTSSAYTCAHRQTAPSTAASSKRSSPSCPWL